MDDLLKGLAGQAQGGQGGQGGLGGQGGIGDLLGGLLGGRDVGSLLGAGVGAGVGNSLGGGMGSMLGGGLGALLPTVLPAVLGMLGGKGSGEPSGMHQLVDTMHANGLGEIARSWVGSGANQPISAAQIAQALTPEQMTELSARTGLPAEQVSAAVAAILPDVVNSLTPNGTLPDHAQVRNTTSQLQDMLAGLMHQGA
jgi:uncharacterized protein YidB (DUF937 family)